jgi:ParB/RepB/Spo0J family partition protein
MSEPALQEIPLSQIRENPVALRQVNRQTEQYLELVESVKENGILNPIVVRPLQDPETGESFFGLIDGLHRFTASQDAGCETIPAHIKSMEDAAVLEAQVIGNIHKIETRPVEYSKQLQKILAQDPLLTASQLAKKLGKSPTWIADRLGLLKVDDKITALIDDGSINLSNAFSLAKLPPEEQLAFADRAQTMTPAEFTATVTERKKQLDKARREGRKADSGEFVAPTHMRKLKEVKTEFESAKIGPTLCKENKTPTPEAGFALGVAWILHQDPTSVAIAKQQDEERRQELKEKREKAKAARTKAKASNAAIKAARLSLESELLEKGASKEEMEKALESFDQANKNEKQEA